MKFMLLIYMDERAMDEKQREHCYEESALLAQDLHASGQFVAASPLHPVSTAKSVRVRDGKTLVTDGPFAETHEQLGGFYLIEAADQREAFAIAAKIPPAKLGTVEIRQVLEIAGLPTRETANVAAAVPG